MGRLSASISRTLAVWNSRPGVVLAISPAQPQKNVFEGPWTQSDSQPMRSLSLVSEDLSVIREDFLSPAPYDTESGDQLLDDLKRLITDDV